MTKIHKDICVLCTHLEDSLARWEQAGGYARVFGYDEEGRLVKIERDYGSGGAQVAYEYGYNSDGARVWKRDVLNEQEYRYLCRIGCGGVPMRVYNRAMSGGRWNTLEEYMDAPTVRWYGTSAESFSDYPLLAGHWLSECASPLKLGSGVSVGLTGQGFAFTIGITF
jgi:hypothetical protein